MSHGYGQNGSPFNQNQERDRATRVHAAIYLAGMFISSFGSLAYAATLPILLFNLGVTTVFIGTLIGTMRLNTFAVNAVLGHIGDRISPRRVMICCELGAAFGSALILICWLKFGTSTLVPFFVANNIRVFFTSLQAGSVQKFAKVFDERAGWNGKMAFWLTGATNGTLLFAGILAIFFFSKLTVELVVFVDFVTFVLNGALLLFFQKPEALSEMSPFTQSTKLTLNIRQYYKSLPMLAALDLVLSVALCGSNTLNVRLLDSRPELVPLMPALFGGAAFLTSFMSGFRITPASRTLWFTYGLSLAGQGIFQDKPLVVLGLSVVRNFAYWLIFQAINRELMQSTPKESFASVAAGRNALSIGVLALGEFWVGLMTGLSIRLEMVWRAIAALMPLVFRKQS